MKNKTFILSILAVLFLSLTSCGIIGGIFKSGVWVGAIIVAVIVIIVFLIARNFRKGT